jgi:hypothetical protein
MPSLPHWVFVEQGAPGVQMMQSGSYELHCKLQQ